MNNSVKLPTILERIDRVPNGLDLGSVHELGYVKDVLRQLVAIAELSGEANAESIADALETAHDLHSFVEVAETAMQYCDDDAMILRKEDSNEILAKKLIATPGVLQMMFIVRCVANRNRTSYAEIFNNLMHVMPINQESPTARFLFKQFSDEKNKMIECVLQQLPELCGSSMYRLDTEAHKRSEIVYEVITISEEEAVAEYESVL